MANLSSLRSQLSGLSVGCLLVTALPVAAQSVADTTHLKYAEETRMAPDTAAPLRVQEQQCSVWKLGVNTVLPTNDVFGPGSRYGRYGLHVIYERQLSSPAWSVVAEVSPSLAHYRPEAGTASSQRLDLQTQVAGRYYYNREQRLRRGRDVGSFAADYLSVAVGAGWGQQARETPFFLYRSNNRQFLRADLALLYGSQRRLGRYIFVDNTIGLVTSLLVGKPQVGLGGNLRVGLLLGRQPPLYRQSLPPADEITTLLPQFYAGAAIGSTFYHMRYSERNPYPAPVVQTTPTETQTTTYPETRAGNGHYPQPISAGPIPYVYGGYYLRPRWALQLGFQYGESFNDDPVGTLFETAEGTFAVPNQTLRERGLALPMLLRYSLTPSFQRRVQFTAVGGLVPVWTSASFREFAIVDRQVTAQETFGFRRRAFDLHATLGIDASYAFGRRRRLQVNLETTFNKNVQTLARFSQRDFDSRTGSFLAGGSSLGLRYRFGYR